MLTCPIWFSVRDRKLFLRYLSHGGFSWWTFANPHLVHRLPPVLMCYTHSVATIDTASWTIQSRRRTYRSMLWRPSSKGSKSDWRVEQSVGSWCRVGQSWSSGSRIRLSFFVQIGNCRFILLLECKFHYRYYYLLSSVFGLQMLHRLALWTSTASRRQTSWGWPGLRQRSMLGALCLSF